MLPKIMVTIRMKWIQLKKTNISILSDTLKYLILKLDLLIRRDA